MPPRKKSATAEPSSKASGSKATKGSGTKGTTTVKDKITRVYKHASPAPSGVNVKGKGNAKAKAKAKAKVKAKVKAKEAVNTKGGVGAKVVGRPRGNGKGRADAPSAEPDNSATSDIETGTLEAVEDETPPFQSESGRTMRKTTADLAQKKKQETAKKKAEEEEKKAAKGRKETDREWEYNDEVFLPREKHAAPVTILNYRDRKIEELQAGLKDFDQRLKQLKKDKAGADAIETFTSLRTLAQKNLGQALKEKHDAPSPISGRVVTLRDHCTWVPAITKKSLEELIRRYQSGDKVLCNLERTTFIVMCNGKLVHEVDTYEEACELGKELHGFWIENPFTLPLSTMKMVGTIGTGHSSKTVTLRSTNLGALWVSSANLQIMRRDYHIAPGTGGVIPRNFYAHLFDTGFTNNIGNPWPQLTGSPEDLNLYLGGPDVRAIIPHGDQVYQCANGMMMMGTKWPVKARFINDSQDAITAWTECEYLVTPAGERLINPLDWRCLYTGSQPPAEKGNDMNQNIHLYISNKKAGIETALEAKRYRFK